MLQPPWHAVRQKLISATFEDGRRAILYSRPHATPGKSSSWTSAKQQQDGSDRSSNGLVGIAFILSSSRMQGRDDGGGVRDGVGGGDAEGVVAGIAGVPGTPHAPPLLRASPVGTGRQSAAAFPPYYCPAT